MKKLLGIIMMLLMVTGITACGGGGGADLAQMQIRSMSISLPADFTVEGSFGDKTNSLASDIPEITLAEVEVSGPFDWPFTPDMDTAEALIKRELSQAKDIDMIEFDNTAKLGDLDMVAAHYTYVINDITTEHYHYDIYHGDGTLTRVEFSFNPTENSSLQENIDAIVESMQVM